MGQIYFALVNPAITAIFAGVFLFLWRRWRHRSQLLILSAAFTMAALGFVFYDISPVQDELVNRIVSNASFLTAITLIAVAALVRAEAAVPKPWFATVLGLSALALTWFQFVVDSVDARVVIMGLSFAALAMTVALLLQRQKPKSTADRMIIAAAWLGVITSLTRPILALVGVISPGDGASVQQSSYWLTIQAFSPIVTGTLALLFLAALSLDTLDAMSNAANSDYLSGLLNRRGFEGAVGKALENAAGKPALILVDIDDFKRINDTYGHKVGDQVIAGVARALSTHGGADFAARIGGEEFALFYADSDVAQLQQNTNAIRSALIRMGIPGIPREHIMTASFGIHCRRGDQGLSEMLSEADRALYRAKDLGKDRAELSTPHLRTVEGGTRSAG